jgi:hypothetical protein
MSSSSPAGMSIQFKTLTFHSRSEEQLQERLHLKKIMTSLSEVIGTLSSPLGPHPKRDLATYLYSFYTPIAIINEFGRRISFNSKKFVISLSATIVTLSSPLGPRLERVLTTDIYSVSTPMSIKMSLITGSISDDFKKATTSL